MLRPENFTGSHLGRSELGWACCHAGSLEPLPPSALRSLHCTPRPARLEKGLWGVVHGPNLPHLLGR